MKHMIKITLTALLCLAVIAGGIAVWRAGLWMSGRVETPVIPDTPGFEMVRRMHLGWNLGNSLSAHYGSLENEPDYGGESKLDIEALWSVPYTTQEMIRMVKEAGFNTLRIPITWAPHIGGAPDFAIDPAWMDRVQEIVDYGYGIGMHVIINTQCDDQYWMIPSKRHEAATTEQFVAVWAQICERFQEYSDRLLFESANEPRVVGSLLEWAGGTISQRAVVNRLNAAFVDTVRASGGGNAERWLLIPTYGASYEPVPMRALKLPNDDRLIVSIHAYHPRDFAFAHNREDRIFNDRVRRDVDKMLGRIYRTFVARGIPVYMGEFGACEKDNEQERAAFAAHYITEARRYGIHCAWWDNGYFPEYDGDDFPVTWALLDRFTLEWRFPAIVEALRTAAGEREIVGG